mmetsp:Transcript_48946/g.106409  ORF Transcript_48946/g.106409 Transcript_48946/m.106409 type:complete len:373 (+) Transcript_48946:585-1703(+)
MVFLYKLLHVLRCGTTSSGLVHAASSQKRDDGEHLGTRPELEDREEIRVVVSEHVSSDGDRIEALACPRHGDPAGLRGSHDLEVQSCCVVVRKVLLNLLNHDGIVSTLGVQPEDCLGIRSPRSPDGKLDPVLDGNVLHLAHAPNVALLNVVFNEHIAASGIDDSNRAVLLHLEGLVMRPVLFRLLRHEPHVWHGAHCGDVESAVLPAVLNCHLEHARIAPIWNDGLAVAEMRVPGARLRVGAPHLPGGADHGRHRCIDNHIARHMQVRDATVRVYHRKLGPLGIHFLDVILNVDTVNVAFRQGGKLCQNGLEAIVDIHAKLLEGFCVLREDVFEEDRHHVPKHNWVRDLHHGGLQVHGEEHIFRLGILNLLC